MDTKIKTVHEEAYSDKSRTLGVLLNTSIDFGKQQEDWKESFVYIYKEGMYIFFDTMIDMLDYLLYGENKMKRAYMSEEEFDGYYDSHHIDGTFNEKLKWQRF
jgi:hypothetical protein